MRSGAVWCRGCRSGRHGGGRSCSTDTSTYVETLGTTCMSAFTNLKNQYFATCCNLLLLSTKACKISKRSQQFAIILVVSSLVLRLVKTKRWLILSHLYFVRLLQMLYRRHWSFACGFSTSSQRQMRLSRSAVHDYYAKMQSSFVHCTSLSIVYLHRLKICGVLGTLLVSQSA